MSEETFEDRLNRALLSYVQRTWDPEATEFSSYWEDVYANQGCETCGPYYEYTVYINVHTPKAPSSRWGNGTKTYSYRGKFGDLLQELT